MINFDADTIIITEGSIEKQMYIVIEGQVEIYIERDDKKILLATIKAPNFLGEMAIYRSQPIKYSAKALTNTRMLTIENQAQLELFVTKNLSLSATMMTIMGNRIAVIDDLLITKMEELNQLNTANPFIA
jgi:CRP-like cAMP-binding protein